MIAYPNGVYCIDAHYIKTGVASIYLLCHQGRIAIVEAGTTRSVPHVLGAIAELGMSTHAVDYVIPTHVHLDHAGGAGVLLEACPNARLVIHPRGERHMIDPGKLMRAAAAVYGQERFDALYGALAPIAQERIDVVQEGDVVDLAGRALVVLDTPGHAKHHICLWDETSGGMFTGDTGGLSYRALDGATPEQIYLFPTTSPTQFDPDDLHHSIDKIMQHQPRYFYLTHFGRIAVNTNIIAKLHQAIDDYVAIAHTKQQAADKTQEIATDLTHYLIKQIESHGIDEDSIRATVAMDMKLNAQGLAHWLDTLA